MALPSRVNRLELVLSLCARNGRMRGVYAAGGPGRLLHSEDEPSLQLEHSRWIYVSERGDCIRGGADASNELAEGGCRNRGIAIGCHTAAEKIAVIENIE